MRDLCARFPLQLRSPNVKLVYFVVVTILFHSTNVARDDNNMGLCLSDNAVWSGSAADGCACGGYKRQNDPQTSKGRGSKTPRK